MVAPRELSFHSSFSFFNFFHSSACISIRAACQPCAEWTARRSWSLSKAKLARRCSCESSKSGPDATKRRWIQAKNVSEPLPKFCGASVSCKKAASSRVAAFRRLACSPVSSRGLRPISAARASGLRVDPFPLHAMPRSSPAQFNTSASARVADIFRPIPELWGNPRKLATCQWVVALTWRLASFGGRRLLADGDRALGSTLATPNYAASHVIWCQLHSVF